MNRQVFNKEEIYFVSPALKYSYFLVSNVQAHAQCTVSASVKMNELPHMRRSDVILAGQSK